ncbi:AMP-binding enzyme [Aspergillus avenaceus]|uniref:AMP-binding enzyme n=1 Tax=Aspergillus avenaceus TaxID=36643 RepID=A0A5N6TMH0_ASPAV|nr:AMP-binding enzyme [Aspergillus avenaceus]
MSTVISRFNIPVPSTDLLTYLLDSPWRSSQGWAADEPLIHSAKGPDAPSCTINQLKHLVKCFACGFQQRAPSNARVVIYGTLNAYLPAVLLGAIGTGACCNISPSYPPPETVARLEAVNADFVFFAPQHLKCVRAAAERAGVPVANLYVLDDSVTGEEVEGVQHWSALLDLAQGPDFEWKRLSEEEAKATTALLTHTSGTTGLPKMAERTHYGLIGNIEQLLYRYHLKERGKHEIFFCTFLYAGIGFILYGLFIPMKARYKSIYMAEYRRDEFLSAVETFRPTSLHTPKHIFQDLLVNAADADFSSVTSLRTGGAMIPFRMCEEWTRCHGSPCEVVCGMTEGGIHFASDPRELETDSTVGELLPNLEAKVVDHTGQPLARGECGEIWIKNPFCMKGYLDKEAATKELFSFDGFIKTGDIGMVNSRGRWYVLGRIKDMFKRNGSHVMASEIEAAVVTHPDILEAVVVPVKLPHEEDDEPMPRGYIVRRPGSDLTVNEFMKWMYCELSEKLRLEGGTEFLDALPVSNGGKIDRNALREKAARDVYRARNTPQPGEQVSQL